MKRSELEAIIAIRAEIHSAFDPHAMAYDQAYRNWLVNDAAAWVRDMIKRENSAVDLALLIAYRAGADYVQRRTGPTTAIIRDELREAFDPHAMAYDQARVMNAHRMLNKLAGEIKARKVPNARAGETE